MDNGKRLPVCKALLHFNTKKGEEVLVKVGVSAVDIAGARKNVESEIPEWDFDKVRKDARTAWNNYLSKIDITTADKEDKTIFYAALYHTARICVWMQTDVISAWTLKYIRVIPSILCILPSLCGILSAHCTR